MKKEKTTTVTGYKALNKDFTCQGFQYEVGKTFKHAGEVELCKTGFHFCQFPLNVLDFYDLVGSRFAEIESDDVRESDQVKSVAGNITIKKEIGFGEMIKAQISIIFSFCFTKTGESKESVIASNEKNAQLASSGDGAKLASSGDGAQLASSGDGAKLASSGDGAQLASSGDGAQLASSGDGAQLASSGDGAQLASSGYGAQLASSGDGAKLASSGDGAQLASSGDGAQLASSGDGAQLKAEGSNSAVAGIGCNNSASGAVGNWLTLAEWKWDGNKHNLLCVKTEQVDGKRIKAGVAYILEKGEFVAQ